MKHIQWYNCLQAPAVREQPHFTSRSTLELEVTFCPSVYSNISTQIGSAGWSAHWPGSCQHQANYIQWIPYTPIWCTPWPHHLLARHPWHSTLQGKLLRVCCRHPQSSHPRSSFMQKVSSCPDELCHHHYLTWHKTSKPCTCSHSNSSQAYCSPCSSQAHQIHWWLD